jgi:hypothetical protein
MTTSIPRLRRFAAAAFLWLGLCVGAGVHTAEACSCVPSKPPCGQVQSDTLIFVGTPTSAVRVANENIRFRFTVEERLAGASAQTVEIETPTTTGACGFPFQIGAKYLVYTSSTAQGLRVSLCSRTGSLEERRDDLDLFKEAAAGRPRARLSGVVAVLSLRLDGFYLHTDPGPDLAGVPITVRGRTRTYETKTDDRGRFTLLGLEPDTYLIEPRLPAPYKERFNRPNIMTLDDCLAEAFIFVAPVALSGVAHRADGQAAGDQVMLRVARLDAANRVAFARTTLAFTDDNGGWSFPGLPPGRYVIGVNTYDAPTPHTPYPTMWYPNARRVADATVIVVSNDRPQTIDFRLPEPLTAVAILGRVVDSNGAGLAEASVTLYDDDDPHAVESWKSSVAYATTDKAGHFRVTGFVGRRYHAEATAPMTTNGPPPKSDLVAVVMDSSPPTVTLTIRRR